MKLKYEFCFQHLGSEWVGVPIGDNALDYDCMLHLNDVGHDIVEMMTEDVEREGIIARLLDAYDADKSEVERCVDASIEYLNGQGLIEY